MNAVDDDQMTDLRSIVDRGLPDPLFVHDHDGRFIDVNEAACRSLGWSRQQLLRMGVCDVEVDYDTDRAQQAWASMVEGVCLPLHGIHRRKDGSTFAVEARIGLDRSSGRRIYVGVVRPLDAPLVEKESGRLRPTRRGSAFEPALVGIAIARASDGRFVDAMCDISGTAQYQRELQQRERLLAAVFDSSPDGLVVFDRERVVHWHNARFGELLRIPPAMLQRTDLRIDDLVRLNHERGEYPSLTLAQILDRYCGILREGRKASFERPAFAGDARLKIEFTPLDGGWCLVSYSDITEASRRAQELENAVALRTDLLFQNLQALEVARDSAEAASRAKSSFLATMSHEIRTPLNGVLGASRLLRASGVTVAQSEHLDRIDASGQHLLELLSDLLDLSTIEAGKLLLANEAFSLPALVAGVEAVLQPQAAEKGLVLDFALETRVAALALRGDKPRLRQVLINLIGNAIKFTGHGTVHTSIVVVEEGPDEVLLRFEIRDDGIGIAESDQLRIFASFEQVDTSLARRHRGAGLGLPISRRLVEMMGGQIGVSSRPGHGSTFWFTARIHRSADAPVQVAEPKSGDATAIERLQRDFAGRRVLLAEDNVINADIAQELLQSAGLRVDVADNGREVVERAAAGRYDLFLMDLQLPGLSGLEAARRLRQFPACARAPIIALTANVSADDRRACVDAGMDDFLAKPVLPEAMFECILKHLARPAPAGPGN